MMPLFNPTPAEVFTPDGRRLTIADPLNQRARGYQPGQPLGTN